MESGRGSCRLPRTLGTQSCSLKNALITVFIFTIHIQWVASERNETVVLASRGEYIPWNKTLLKTENKCKEFHDNDTASLFFYWPEDDRRFQFCCTLNDSSYNNYTYGSTGPLLYYLGYYDLGLIDRCLPYWKCLHLFELMMKHELFAIYCEFTDLRGLYRRRFFYDTVLKRGLLQSAIPFILFAEIAVIAFVAVYWVIRRRYIMDGSKRIMRKATKAWQLAVRKRVFKDWTHLCLLAIIGNGLIEAVGRQFSVGAQSKAFYNYGRLYLALSILVWFSSVLHQISIYIAELEFSYRLASLSQSRLEADSAGWAISRQTSEAVELEDEMNVGKDWEWQPIGAQAGILFCLWGFLTYAQNDGTTGAVFGIIVSAAAPWSGLYASKIIVHTFPWILVKVYRNLFKARNAAGASQETYRAAWTAGIQLPRGGSPDSHGTSPV